MPAYGDPRGPERQPRRGRSGSSVPTARSTSPDRERRDNLAATFSSDLVDYWIFFIDVAGGDDSHASAAARCPQADLLVVNKVDLAPHVGADLELMCRDAKLSAETSRRCSPTSAPMSGRACLLDRHAARGPLRRGDEFTRPRAGCRRDLMLLMRSIWATSTTSRFADRASSVCPSTPAAAARRRIGRRRSQGRTSRSRSSSGRLPTPRRRRRRRRGVDRRGRPRPRGGARRSIDGGALREPRRSARRGSRTRSATSTSRSRSPAGEIECPDHHEP